MILSNFLNSSENFNLFVIKLTFSFTKPFFFDLQHLSFLICILRL